MVIIRTGDGRSIFGLLGVFDLGNPVVLKIIQYTNAANNII